ncbi:unnamed protein product [Symbiodinium sp. CCMP2592]|nr:unnamed protein product [Symbiodinium sp. CCMP2592]
MEAEPATLSEICVLLRLWRPGAGATALPKEALSSVNEYLRPPELLLQLANGIVAVSLETGQALRFFDTSKFGNADCILGPAAIYDFALCGEVQSHPTASGFELRVQSNQISCLQCGRPQVWQSFNAKSCATAYTVRPGSASLGCIAERAKDVLHVHLGSAVVSDAHNWLATAVWRSRQELEITVWDSATGNARGRFTCDGWYQHTFSGRAFSMFAWGRILIACGTKAGAGGHVYAAVNVYEITETVVRQLRDDPFCHSNEFVGFSFMSPNLRGITVSLDLHGPRIVTSSFGSKGLTELEEMFKPTVSAPFDLSGLIGASLEGEFLVSWRMHGGQGPEEEWLIVEAWHVADVALRADLARAPCRAWSATLREELLFVATRPRTCRALEALLPSPSSPPGQGLSEHWQKWPSRREAERSTSAGEIEGLASFAFPCRSLHTM